MNETQSLKNLEGPKWWPVSVALFSAPAVVQFLENTSNKVPFFWSVPSRAVGNVHFCDTTNRASQRLTPHRKGEFLFLFFITEVGDEPRVIPQPLQGAPTPPKTSKPQSREAACTIGRMRSPVSLRKASMWRTALPHMAMSMPKASLDQVDTSWFPFARLSFWFVYCSRGTLPKKRVNGQ